MSERLEYLEKAFSELSTCYDGVSARCIEAEKKVEGLTKLVGLADERYMDLLRRQREAVEEIENYSLTGKDAHLILSIGRGGWEDVIEEVVVILRKHGLVEEDK